MDGIYRGMIMIEQNISGGFVLCIQLFEKTSDDQKVIITIEKYRFKGSILKKSLQPFYDNKQAKALYNISTTYKRAIRKFVVKFYHKNIIRLM